MSAESHALAEALALALTEIKRVVDNQSEVIDLVRELYKQVTTVANEQARFRADFMDRLTELEERIDRKGDAA